MRKKRSKSGLTVNAIAGTHVVMLGFHLAQKKNGLLGFAIQREDHTEDERYWLTGMKTFQSTAPDIGLGGQASSRDHPFQTFQWADYSAKPDHDYTYRVIPLSGAPSNLTEGPAVEVRIQTESEFGGTHSVFFNRGAAASQEYARRFLNKRPSEVGPAAYTWLSRGLIEALLTFIARANGATFGIHGAVYEFQWPAVLAALKAAAGTGARVRVIFDAIPNANNQPAKANKKAIADAHIKTLTRERTNGRIMHNKFFVLTKNSKPIAVWTGSTNLTQNGIFGHSNCGHVVDDPDVAQVYLDYWKELADDPDNATIKDWNKQNTPAPPSPWSDDTTVIFSPRSGIAPLDWYASIAGGAQRALFMTFAFGMHEKFKQVYEQDDGVLRFALMEKEGNGSGLAQGRIDIRRIRALPNVVVAIGNRIVTNSFDRWLAELPKVTPEAHVLWIHTKYMLVDPLGTKPIVVTGSANFSKASTDTNDENMLVIRNNTRIADIYFGEFMRLYSHYAFRDAVRIHQEQGGAAADWKPQYLAETDAWQKSYFDPGDQRCMRRLYFSGH